ncbi:laminin subunit beta-3 [Eublepharis macularius]|uniref:Laminin subunit beta-3 n=1 Tax=Eublepharis macularius TaxID=481883 RepID=A0AA97JE61_EUBMA|nr:laminin subunit beta-3 [Eublepharis macularius]XP_054836951.1 laminin subunit beta-3 [Eublepharis macularius]
MWIILFILASSDLLAAQRTCSDGACYPPVGDLLVGRIHHLKASSTCGLVQPETYCTPYGEWQMKCCRCDSRTPHAFNSHRVDNVLSSKGQMRWWQSQNDVNPVSLELDLDKKFQLSSILLDFRSPLPVGMVIERSTDYGASWKVFQYLSTDCATSFPWISRGLPQSWQDVRCQDMQTHHRPPQGGGKIEFSLIGLTSGMITSRSQSINNLAEFTNLRINFTHLSRPPHQGYRLPSAFYALTEMQVQGTCFCNGHAERCAAPDASSREPNAVVHGHCVCQHNTAGPNCEHCAVFFNDQPWRPAEDNNPHECRRCNCNGHSNKCYFDPAVYQASGGVSGGVCEDCQHNTAGRNCEHCKTYFFRNRRYDLSHPEACLPCECDPDGTVPGSSCDPMSGRCVCKDNVQGDRCHLCKPGFTQLVGSNPQGCRDCACNILGSRKMPCDDETGRCFCLPNVVGDKCDKCAVNHWKIASGEGCQPCNCDPRNSLSSQCNQFTGQCPCREGYRGLMCSASGVQFCPDQSYGDVRTGCRACDCNFRGTEEVGCDKLTGSCQCRSGFTGSRCDQCQRGYCGNYHSCEACHPCFQAYDEDIHRFGLRQATLKNSTQRLQLGTLSSSFNTRLLEAEGEIQSIQRILGNALITEQGLDHVASTIATLRQTIAGLRSEIPLMDEMSSLTVDMDALARSLLLITAEYQNKKVQFETSRSTDLSGAFKTVGSSYQTSSNASMRIAGSSRLLAQSMKNRENTEELVNSLADRGSGGLEALQGELAFSPNLTPVINKICSGIRLEICSPGECHAELCPQHNATECGPGLACRGIVSRAGSSIQIARKTTQEIHNLSIRLQETIQMIRSAEIAANQIQANARSLGDKMSTTRTQIDGDIQRTQQFIRQVRNFLSDPDTDAVAIQQVSNYVLSLRLPTDFAMVLRKMNEIQNLAAKLQCPESIIAQTAGDIARAKKLQQEAQEARNRANAIEGNLEDVAENLRKANTALQAAEDTIHGSGYSLRLIQDRLDEIQMVLSPAEKGVQDITDQLDNFTKTLSQLRHKANQNRVWALDAQQKAVEASEQARSTQQEFEMVKQKYAELKKRMGQGSNLGAQGIRIQSVQMEASTLFKETLGMMAKMGALETEVQESNNAFILESAKLAGLEKQVETIRDHISRRAAYFATCTD